MNTRYLRFFYFAIWGLLDGYTCFNAQDNIIEQITIPDKNQHEEERAYQLKQKDLMETSENNVDIENGDVEEDDDFRRTFKTIEVLGHVIKNRAGSIEKINWKKCLLKV